jgi:hypothetical protein
MTSWLGLLSDHSYYGLQQGDEFFDFVGVLFVEDVGTELPHKAGVVREAAPPLEHRSFDFYSVGNVANPSRAGTTASLHLLILIRTIRLY